jgi:hypothetical protein
VKKIPFAQTFIACAVTALVMPTATWAETENSTLNEVKVISTTPLEGIGLSIDKVPANVQVVKSKQLEVNCQRKKSTHFVCVFVKHRKVLAIVKFQ